MAKAAAPGKMAWIDEKLHRQLKREALDMGIPMRRLTDIAIAVGLKQLERQDRKRPE